MLESRTSAVWNDAAVSCRPGSLNGGEEMRSPATAALPETTSESAPMQVLLIEDDRNIQRSISFQLGRQGYEVICSEDGEDGLERALKHRYHVIVLDIMLPKLDGLSVCKRVRRVHPEQPIIITSARGTDLDKITGLEFGADDYLAKPFSPAELEARIRAVRRRLTAGREASEPKRIRVGQIVLDKDRREALCQDRAVRLTPKEFDLLYLLMRNPGRAFSREALLTQVWGYGYEGYHRAVDAQVNRLRAKFEASLGKAGDVIEAVYGVGYRMKPE